jgi:mannose/fructose/N-acetylgalactosamine-specific phosphotransferase system component IIB
MSLALVRVDERLIHGQVTVGWGSRLAPARYVVVDDRLPGSGWEKDLIALGVPPGAASEFVTVKEARARLEGWIASAEPLFLLTRDLDHMLRLARGGTLRGFEVNLGGIHHGAGRNEVLPYLYLDSEDRARIRELESEGAQVSARDLPGSPRTETGDLLR